LGIATSVDNLASTSTFGGALYDEYQAGTSDSKFADYTGKTNIAPNKLWQTYSESFATAGNIINSVYTDILAAAVVGTRSGLLSNPSNGSTSTTTPNALALVQNFEPKVRYKIGYAIPAFLALLLTPLMLLAAFLM
jgi:hypothetical protein